METVDFDLQAQLVLTPFVRELI